MADNVNEVIENVKRGSTWKRVLFVVGFCVVLYVVSVVIWFLAGAQALFSIFTGSDNRNLRLLGSSLAQYVNQILKFITFNSEYLPFPFSQFPDAIGGDAESPAGAVDDEAGEPADTVIDPDQDAESTQSRGRATGDDGHQFDDLAFLGREDETTEEPGEDAEDNEVSRPAASVIEADADEVLPEWTDDDEGSAENPARTGGGNTAVKSEDDEAAVQSGIGDIELKKYASGKDSSSMFSSLGFDKGGNEEDEKDEKDKDSGKGEPEPRKDGNPE